MYSRLKRLQAISVNVCSAKGCRCVLQCYLNQRISVYLAQNPIRCKPDSKLYLLNVVAGNAACTPRTICLQVHYTASRPSTVCDYLDYLVGAVLAVSSLVPGIPPSQLGGLSIGPGSHSGIRHHGLTVELPYLYTSSSIDMLLHMWFQAPYSSSGLLPIGPCLL